MKKEELKINNALTINSSINKLFRNFESSNNNIYIIYLLNLIFKLINNENINIKKRNKLLKLYNTILNKYSNIICKSNNNKKCVINTNSINKLEEDCSPENIIINNKPFYIFQDINISLVVSEISDEYLETKNSYYKSELNSGTTLNLKEVGFLFIVAPKEYIDSSFKIFDELGNDITSLFIVHPNEDYLIIISSIIYTHSNIYIKIEI